MADCKKYNGSTWQHSLRKLTTSTDTLTTLPAVLYPNDTTITVGVKGQSSQSGTPTPQNPIDVLGTGERTAQLFNKSAAELVGYTLSGTTFTPTAEICHIDYKLPSGTYTLSCDNDKTLYIRNGKVASGYISQKASKQASTTFTYNASVDGYLRISSFGSTVSDIMLNIGSTALPYEPYGYKIPISMGGTTTPVYLGEVQTTRQIKKWVLTGQEDWAMSTFFTSGFYLASVTSDYMRIESGNLAACTHYVTVNQTTSVGNLTNKQLSFSSSNTQRLYICDINYTTAETFKTYLQQQYSNGTPVTVWYVLATPETAVVNEPLRKIGDYADEVSGIAIPTITSKDTFDVETTLKPSEVSLSYTGWHDATVKEWDGSQWQ